MALTISGVSGIFDANGKPNDKDMAFVAAHVEWGMKPENGQFRRVITRRRRQLRSRLSGIA